MTELKKGVHKMIFENLEQRMAQRYIDMFPPFIPDENASVSISAQEEFYTIMKKLYRLAFNEPLLFVPSLHKDDAYPNRFDKKSYGKPDLQTTMKKFTKTVDSLLQTMFFLGQGRDIKINKRQQEILSKIGVENVGTLPAAWEWMSKRENANLITFSHCLFNKNYSYASDIYAHLFGNEAFRKIENWMLAQGYKQFNIYDVTASDCRLSLTYANPIWDKERPNGGFEYKIKHTGISARYDSFVKQPAVMGLCIPKGLMKSLLHSYNLMNESLKEFIIKQTTKCWDCRFCVQTDKTGLRPLAYTIIEHKKIEYKLCEYFPGYSYCWTSITPDLADQIIEMLSFMDKFVPNKKTT